MASLSSPPLLRRFHERYGTRLQLNERLFNAGVFVFNLQRWAALNLTAEVEYWVRANNVERLYSLGSQPPLMLAIIGATNHGRKRCQALPREWHVDCLGCPNRAASTKSQAQLAEAKLLHWNGPHKPYSLPSRHNSTRRRGNVELFRPYAGRGKGCEHLASPDVASAGRA